MAAAATAWAVCTRVRSAARRAVCTCVRGAAHRAVLSDSSSESLFSATECRRTCSRGPRRSADPSSTWMEGTSKWTRSVDMLSPGDTPSSTGCSEDCGLEAARLTVGGWGGGRVGLWRGFGVGRDLLRAPVKPEGEASGGAGAAGESWPDARE